MSIIERALSRIRGEQPGTAADSARRGNQPSAAPRARGAAGATEAPRRRPPAESVDADSAYLRSHGLLPAVEHDHVLTEQFRRLKLGLLGSRDGSPTVREGDILMVASSIAGEGKSFTTFNLALSIARGRDSPVLLIDGDVAKRHLTHAMRAEGRRGLTDLLEEPDLDPESLILGTNLPGLTFLPAGRRVDSAPELFASQRMTQLAQILSGGDEPRMVLIDSGPLLVTSESQVLARLAQWILLVVRAGSTTQSTVAEAIGLLDQHKQIRCVLNQARGGALADYYYGGYNNYGEAEKK
jgi:protein-tyrosine kinase